MTFGYPSVLWMLLATVAVLAGFLFWAWKKRQKDILLFIRSRLLAELTVGLSSFRRKLRLVLLVCGVAAIMLALARPRWGVTYEELKQRGLDIIVAIDTSRSMTAEDVAPNRLARAKLAAMELLPLAKRDRLGLAAFAGSAFLQCPLTLDEEAFRQSVDALDIGLIPQGGTALAEAIQVAETTFQNEEDNVKVLVLITDGEDHEAGALEEAQKAAKQGIRVFTIGVGTPEGEMLRQRDANDPFFKDTEGNAVKSRLNESLLRQIADAGKGFYLPLRGPKVMDTLYERGLSPLLGMVSGKLGDRAEKQQPRVLKQYRERFQWPLAAAILLLLAEMFLPERKLVRKPDKSIIAGGAGNWGKLAAAGICLLSVSTLHASSSSAMRSYRDGHYQSSMLEYKRLHEKNPQDPRLAYNAGSAAYQAKRYEEAQTLFNDALKAPDVSLQERSYYNLGNTLFRSGQQMDDPGQKQEAWQNAVQNYENALKLNPKDENAKFNLELVKKQLEELKRENEQKDQKQNQDQKDQKDKDDQKQDQKDQKDQKNQQNQDQKQDPPDKQDKKEDPKKEDPAKKPEDKSGQDKNKPEGGEQKPTPKQDEQKNGQNKEPEPPKPTDQNQDKGKEPKKTDAAPKPAPGTRGDQKDQKGESANAASVPLGMMTKEQAEKLLDALKHEEKAMIFKPTDPQKSPPRSFKDW